MAEPLRKNDYLTQALDEPSPRRMSLEAFLVDSAEGRWLEWVDGEVITMSPSSVQHQKIGIFLKGLLQLFIEHHGLGILLDAPFSMVLRDQQRVREPDILFLAHQHEDRLRKAHLEGPADLVVEIVSPESVGRDRGEKFVEYEAAGVQEYWLIDPQRKQLELYRLGEDSCYHPQPAEADGAPRSRVLPGFPLRPDWLFRDPPPPVLEAARELGVV